MTRPADAPLNPALPEVERERVGYEDVLDLQRHQSLDVVLEFSDVARPLALHEDIQEFARQRRNIPAFICSHRCGEVSCQRRDVRAPLPQRRHLDGQDIDPEEQIAAEASALDEAGEVLVRGRDHTDIHRNGPRTTDRHHGSFREGAQ